MIKKTMPLNEYDKILELVNKKKGDYNLVKANISDSIEKYKSGNGEGMWVIVDKDIYDKVMVKARKRGTFYGYLANNCLYFPELMPEVFNKEKNIAKALKFEYRGEYRPVLTKAKVKQLLKNHKSS
jgi:hypothetical protein